GSGPVYGAIRDPGWCRGRRGAQACNHLPARRRRRHLGGLGAVGNRRRGNRRRGHGLRMPTKARKLAPPLTVHARPSRRHIFLGAIVPPSMLARPDLHLIDHIAVKTLYRRPASPRARARLAIVGVLTHVLDGVTRPAFIAGGQRRGGAQRRQNEKKPGQQSRLRPPTKWSRSITKRP